MKLSLNLSWRKRIATRVPHKKQGTSTGDFLCLPRCDSSCPSLIPAEPVLLRTRSSGYVWRASMRGWNVCSFLPPEICFKPLLRVPGPKLPLAELFAVRARDEDRDGDGNGDRDRPALPPSLPPRQLQAPIASEQPGRMVLWLFFPSLLMFLLVSVMLVRRNNRADCLLSGWVPGHRHGQLVRHRSPCSFSDTRGYWWQPGAVLLLHRCSLLAHLKRTRYPVV